MQSSLFDDASAVERESVEAINAELLDAGRLRFPNKVFILGAGALDSDIAIVGESPGPPDAASGKPFNGPAGEMLARILAAINIRIDDSYLTNAVKFISQGEEITSEIIAYFAPFLRREILAIEPRVIILLGNSPTKALLDTKQPISKVRGQFFDFFGIRAMPTFNPAYLLRDPTKKREVWEDMKKVREYLAAAA